METAAPAADAAPEAAPPPPPVSNVPVAMDVSAPAPEPAPEPMEVEEPERDAPEPTVAPEEGGPGGEGGLYNASDPQIQLRLFPESNLVRLVLDYYSGGVCYTDIFDANKAMACVRIVIEQGLEPLAP